MLPTGRRVIRKWATEEARGLGPFGTAPMENTRFDELTVQLGYPYVYVHQGGCEHLMVFTDLRLHDWRTDPPADSGRYPLLVGTVPRPSRYCSLCDLNAARWIVLDNQRLPYDPFFFCEDCFYQFNYDSEKRKIGSFRAYPYLDGAALA